MGPKGSIHDSNIFSLPLTSLNQPLHTYEYTLKFELFKDFMVINSKAKMFDFIWFAGTQFDMKKNVGRTLCPVKYEMTQLKFNF